MSSFEENTLVQNLKAEYGARLSLELDYKCKQERARAKESKYAALWAHLVSTN
jgi:hypothetical protein